MYMGKVPNKRTTREMNSKHHITKRFLKNKKRYKIEMTTFSLGPKLFDISSFSESINIYLACKRKIIYKPKDDNSIFINSEENPRILN